MGIKQTEECGYFTTSTTTTTSPTTTTTTTLPPKTTTTTSTTTEVEPTTTTEVDDCLDYSDWISRNEPEPGTDESENIIDVSSAAGFKPDDVVKVQCRSKNQLVDSQRTGEKVICNLKDGL